MIRHSKILLAFLAGTMCLTFLLISPVGAYGMDMDAKIVPRVNSTGDPGQQMVVRLVLPDEQDIGITATGMTFEPGDSDAVRALVGEYFEKSPIGSDEEFALGLSVCDCGRSRAGELKRKDRVESHLIMIEEQGIDVTDIRVALELDDMDAVRILMAELREECMPDVDVDIK